MERRRGARGARGDLRKVPRGWTRPAATTWRTYRAPRRRATSGRTSCARYWRPPAIASPRRRSREPACPPADSEFEALLEFLKRSRGFDFTGYKRTSLERRIRRRMETVGCESFGDYLDYLEVHPDEYDAAVRQLLINVTEFFRDPPAWEHLRDEALPALLAGKADDEPIRVWSAGCASGPGGLHGRDGAGRGARRRRLPRAREDLRDRHRRGRARPPRGWRRTRAKEIERVPEELRERYFERADQRYAFRKDLRRTVIFGRNNLVADAPISRLDLLVCRNTLMYFNAETQGRILRHFHFALRDPGVLMLGQVRDDDLAPRPLRRRPTSSRRDLPQAAAAPTCRRASPASPTASAATADATRTGASRDAAFERGAAGAADRLAHRRAHASPTCARARCSGIGLEDIGRPFAELRRPPARSSCAARSSEALRERRRVRARRGRRSRPTRGERGGST